MFNDDVIGMAWADRISFEEIKKRTGLNEKEVIKIMRINLKKGIRLVRGKYETEASGGVSLKNVRRIAASGVKRISVGQITHSAPSIIFNLEI